MQGSVVRSVEERSCLYRRGELCRGWMERKSCMGYETSYGCTSAISEGGCAICTLFVLPACLVFVSLDHVQI